jgi:hypothetical protein
MQDTQLLSLSKRDRITNPLSQIQGFCRFLTRDNRKASAEDFGKFWHQVTASGAELKKGGVFL